MKVQVADDLAAVGSAVTRQAVAAFGEAGAHPHVMQRSTLIEVDGIEQAAPAPRFSRTPAGRPASPSQPGADTAEVFAEWLSPGGA